MQLTSILGFINETNLAETARDWTGLISAAYLVAGILFLLSLG